MTDENSKQKFSEFDVFLAYLNEDEDKELTEKLLLSDEACQQLSALQNDMKQIMDIQENYEHDDEYGMQLWSNIASQLDETPKPSWLKQLIYQWQQPRFSTIGLMLMFVMAINFYFLGKNHSNVVNYDSQSAYSTMLAQNVNLHLAQTDVFLTQISNMNDAQDATLLINAAESLLVTNRIYKNAFAHSDNKRLQSLLTELEKVLIEVSNGHSPIKQNHLQNYTKDQLLFKVKSARQQLTSQSVPTMST